MKNHILFLGFGYCAAALSGVLDKNVWQQSATCRTQDKAQALTAQNITPLLLPPSLQEQTIPEDITHIVVSAPPITKGEDETGDIFLPDFKAMDLPQLKWLGYLSTTGVYGDKGGAMVNEDTLPAPTSARGMRRLAAEQGWGDWCAKHNIAYYIFRLAGIYGAGRNACARVQAGKARRIYKEGQLFSRIHIEDITQILWAAIKQESHSEPQIYPCIYNVCDDMPAPPQDVIAYAAQLLGQPPPPLIDYDKADLSPMAQSFYEENKRVDNQRIKDELGVRLRYPNYKIGLEALYEAGKKTGQF